MYASSLHYVLSYRKWVDCQQILSLSKFAHLTYDIEDIEKFELTFIYILIIIVTYK